MLELEPSPADPVQVVVRSIGTAGFAVVNALEPLCPLSGPDIARVLYRAPGQLFPRLPSDTARALAQELERVGLEVELLPVDAEITPGEGRFDVALEVRDFSRAGELLREVIQLLGLDGRAARDLLCSTPCQLIGQVSEPTVAALDARFCAHGASTRAVDPRASRYDLYVVATSPHLAARLLETLHALGHAPEPAPAGRHDLPRRVPGLSWDEAQRAWEAVGRRGDAVLLINQAFERFDVVLDGCADVAAIAAPLVTLTGMPEAIVGRVLERLPVVVLNNVSYDEALGAQRALAAAGAEVHAELLSLQSFTGEITRCARAAETARVLGWLLDLPPADAQAGLRALPFRLPNPLSAMRARWLQAELTALGTGLRLVKR